MTTISQFRVSNIPLVLYDPVLGQYERTTSDTLEHILRTEHQLCAKVESLKKSKNVLAALVRAPAVITSRTIVISGHRLSVGAPGDDLAPFEASWHLIGYVSGLPELCGMNAHVADSILQAMINSVATDCYVEVRRVRNDPTVVKVFADVEGPSHAIIDQLKKKTFPCMGGVVRVKASVQINRSAPTMRSAFANLRVTIPRTPSNSSLTSSDGAMSRSTSASSLCSLSAPLHGSPAHLHSSPAHLHSSPAHLHSSLQGGPHEFIRKFCRSECVAQRTQTEHLLAACDGPLSRDALDDACDRAYEHWVRLLRLRVLASDPYPPHDEQEFLERMSFPTDPQELMRKLRYQERYALSQAEHELKHRHEQLAEIKRSFLE
jgi:hypothetical protein